MARLVRLGPLAIELLAQLTDQFTLGPGQAVVVGRDGENSLFMLPLKLDLVGVPARAAIALGMPPQPVGEAEISHAATVKASGPEGHGAGGTRCRR
jgi:hypothetical protein